LQSKNKKKGVRKKKEVGCDDTYSPWLMVLGLFKAFRQRQDNAEGEIKNSGEDNEHDFHSG